MPSIFPIGEIINKIMNNNKFNHNKWVLKQQKHNFICKEIQLIILLKEYCLEQSTNFILVQRLRNVS